MIVRTVLSNGLGLQCAGSIESERAIIVLQEAFGVNDHIREVTERFAQHGYYAVAPELFHRDGSPEVAYDNFQDAMGAMGHLNADGFDEDLKLTAAHLSELGFSASSIGVVGYCMGGTVSLYADTLGIVGAAVTFYGGGVATGRFGLAPLVELASELKAPWLGLYGDVDQGIPIEQVEALRVSAARAHVVTEIVRYSDAQHGFHCDGRAQVFNPPAAADAAQRTYEFLEAHLKTR